MPWNVARSTTWRGVRTITSAVAVAALLGGTALAQQPPRMSFGSA